MTNDTITLVPITDKNRAACLALGVHENQKGFVATNRESMQMADEHPDTLHPVGAYVNGKLIGFSLYGPGDDGFAWIIRMMVDKNHQGKGHGRRLLEALVETLPREIPCSEIRLCVEPENDLARRLYESVGFENTGELWEGELVHRLPLATKESAPFQAAK